jgi:hypothetical protein
VGPIIQLQSLEMAISTPGKRALDDIISLFVAPDVDSRHTYLTFNHSFIYLF